MNFFPTIDWKNTNLVEAVVILPDVQMEFHFRCDSKTEVTLSTVFETARWSCKARWGELPSVSAERRLAAKRLAIESILKRRRDYAEQQVERFRRPFQRSFSF